MLSSTVILAVVGFIAATAGAPPPNFSIQAGFEYVGTADGKVLVMPMLTGTEEYGITWREAFLKCTTAGYRMATITSQALDDVVRKFIYSFPGIDSKKWSWIDGTNFASEDKREFFSLNTGKTLEYSNWVKGRPAPSESAYKPQCLRWSHNSQEFGWWDVECSDHHNVICEASIA